MTPKRIPSPESLVKEATRDDAAERLDAWWMEKARDDADRVLPKAMEYGAIDLAIMGSAMDELLPQLADEDLGREAAIAFYVLGKIARIISALKDGRMPDVDSWFDVGIYAQIAQYERDGKWPGL